MDTAIDVVRKTCAYTNHTILAEALEKWPIAYLEKVVPQLMPIIRELDARVRRDFHDERVYIIDKMDPAQAPAAYPPALRWAPGRLSLKCSLPWLLSSRLFPARCHNQ